MNRKFGKLVDGKIEYSPDIIRVGDHDVISPSDDQLLTVGYKRIVDVRPETDETHYAVATGWAETESAIIRGYETREIEQAPRVFSKLKCYAALQAAGYWDAVQSWLETSGLWTAFLLAQNVSENHPQFVAGLNAIKSALNLTDEQAEDILANCVEG